ncbi:hypothetical protein D3C85_1837280 [compost metagenome]
MGDRRGGFDDQLQRQDDQSQANTDAAHLAYSRLFTREKEDYPDKNQQRRQP